MHHEGIWIISLLSIAGVVIRPLKFPEAVWAVAGALLLLILQFISPSEALTGVLKGNDVYLFLTGMMLLSETAREEKLFDWLAGYAMKFSNGSSGRLFILIYIVGTIVTTFLSNNATAVVLTPAVAAAVRNAKVKNPLPYLLICAFIANAASFVLPISNPANLVIFGNNLPSLTNWLSRFIVPSVVSILITFILLKYTQRSSLKESIQTIHNVPSLSFGALMSLIGIIVTAVVLLVCSAKDIQLGFPTAITGAITTCVVLICSKKNPVAVIKGISWSVIPLVGGLFIIVAALNSTGLSEYLGSYLHQLIIYSQNLAVWVTGVAVAFGCNLMNNLPAGLICGSVIQGGSYAEIVKNSVLIGIDLGPNLSITGSLATILWLVALRREGISISFWQFFKLGILIMTVTLIFTIASLLLI